MLLISKKYKYAIPKDYDLTKYEHSKDIYVIDYFGGKKPIKLVKLTGPYLDIINSLMNIDKTKYDIRGGAWSYE